MNIKEMNTNLRSSWLLNKFSLSAHKEIYREQYGQNTYRGVLKGVKSLSIHWNIVTELYSRNP